MKIKLDRASFKKLKKLRNATVILNKSSYERVKKKKEYFDKNNVVFLVESYRGRPLEKHISLVKKIWELRNAGFSYREIEKITGVPKSSVYYILNKAVFSKIKKDGKIYYIGGKNGAFETFNK